jgi:hypothetical protein
MNSFNAPLLQKDSREGVFLFFLGRRSYAVVREASSPWEEFNVPRTVRVAVNAYGVIGKRVADAVRMQSNIELVMISDVVSDYRIKTAVTLGIPSTPRWRRKPRRWRRPECVA